MKKKALIIFMQFMTLIHIRKRTTAYVYALGFCDNGDNVKIDSETF